MKFKCLVTGIYYDTNYLYYDIFEKRNMIECNHFVEVIEEDK
jgi:hypothetical protein